jgi:hypothetical protein
VVIGLLISNGRGKNSTNNIPAAEAVVPGKQAVYKTQKLPPSSLPPAQETTQAGDDKSLSQTNQPVNYNKETAGIEKKKAKTAKAVPADSLLHSNSVATANKDAEALTAHRETIHKTDAPDAKETIKDNIMDYVAIGASKYTVGTFGGISDLQLTVSNRSTYPLDLVVVEVQYVQSNKKTFKTENIYFHDIGAGSALMQEAPKSPRGIKVQYRITLINSKELGLSYSDL